MAASISYRRLRVPRDDGGWLIEPDWPACLAMPAQNSEKLTGYDLDLHGRSFQSLRQAARADLIRLAAGYTRHYSDVEVGTSRSPIIVTGHQPELFHPGVWVKNFAVDRIARHAGGLAVHIIIDNDLCRTHSLSIPTGEVTRPQVVSERFDHFASPIPFETREVHDVELLRTFASRARQRISTLVSNPVVDTIWPSVVEAVHQGAGLGHAMARGRHRLEQAWRLRSLEVPLSQLCETFAFRWLVLHLLLRGDRVRTTYNRRLAEYRVVHRLRSSAQPLPDLQQSDGWTEAPFWIWTTHDGRRRALWFRRAGRDLVIGDRDCVRWTLSHPEADPDAAVQHLQQLADQGLRIRPRALSNTLYIRLFLADLFVHGIGGAKYDQVTDCWIADLFQVKPPSFVALSLSAHLPIVHESVSPAELTATRRELREMRFHPERFLSPEEVEKNQVSHWIGVKYGWIGQRFARGQRLPRHRGIVDANAQLQKFLQKKRERKEQLLAHQQLRLDACRVLESREWSFCLFPEDFLRKRLLELGGPPP